MKKSLFTFLSIFAATVVHAQTNSDVVKIVEQALCYESAGEIHDFFLNCGFRLLEDDVARSLGAESGETVYIDSQNRLYCWTKVDPHDFWHSIRIRLTFDSWRSAQATFAACGYTTASLCDEQLEFLKENPNKFLLSKKIVRDGNISDYISLSGDHVTVYLQGSKCMVYADFSGPNIDVDIEAD